MPEKYRNSPFISVNDAVVLEPKQPGEVNDKETVRQTLIQILQLCEAKPGIEDEDEGSLPVRMNEVTKRQQELRNVLKEASDLSYEISH